MKNENHHHIYVCILVGVYIPIIALIKQFVFNLPFPVCLHACVSISTSNFSKANEKFKGLTNVTNYNLSLKLHEI